MTSGNLQMPIVLPAALMRHSFGPHVRFSRYSACFKKVRDLIHGSPSWHGSLKSSPALGLEGSGVSLHYLIKGELCQKDSVSAASEWLRPSTCFVPSTA